MRVLHEMLLTVVLPLAWGPPAWSVALPGTLDCSGPVPGPPVSNVKEPLDGEGVCSSSVFEVVQEVAWICDALPCCEEPCVCHAGHLTEESCGSQPTLARITCYTQQYLPLRFYRRECCPGYYPTRSRTCSLINNSTPTIPAITTTTRRRPSTTRITAPHIPTTTTTTSTVQTITTARTTTMTTTTTTTTTKTTTTTTTTTTTMKTTTTPTTTTTKTTTTTTTATAMTSKKTSTVMTTVITAMAPSTTMAMTTAENNYVVAAANAGGHVDEMPSKSVTKNKDMSDIILGVGIPLAVLVGAVLLAVYLLWRVYGRKSIPATPPDEYEVAFTNRTYDIITVRQLPPALPAEIVKVPVDGCYDNANFVSSARNEAIYDNKCTEGVTVYVDVPPPPYTESPLTGPDPQYFNACAGVDENPNSEIPLSTGQKGNAEFPVYEELPELNSFSNMIHVAAAEKQNLANEESEHHLGQK